MGNLQLQGQKVNDVGLEDAETKKGLKDPMEILHQNINIANDRKDITAKREDSKKPKVSKIRDEAEVEQIMKEMRQLHEGQEALEQRMNKREKAGWDLKFQNYWGYTVAAQSNMEKSQAMCEKLFTHIGEFRAEASRIFTNIIDRLHVPESQRVEGDLQPKTFDRRSEESVLIDEQDDRLYQSMEPEHHDLGQLDFSMAGQNIYFQNNIIFKITNPNELAYAH